MQQEISERNVEKSEKVLIDLSQLGCSILFIYCLYRLSFISLFMNF